MRITFAVPGKPQGKGRPRHMKNGHTYTPKETRMYECRIREAYRLQSGYAFPPDVPIAVNVLAFFPIPKSFTRKQRALIEQGKLFPLVKPDEDNIKKAVNDALNGIAYADDKQIVDGRCRKLYAYGGSRSECLLITISNEVSYEY